jgi:hypothetical protein
MMRLHIGDFLHVADDRMTAEFQLFSTAAGAELVNVDLSGHREFLNESRLKRNSQADRRVPVIAPTDMISERKLPAGILPDRRAVHTRCADPRR